jgi:hypothetical protein
MVRGLVSQIDPKKEMLTMIMNEQQTMPYYLSDELASKPYNRKLPTK